MTVGTLGQDWSSAAASASASQHEHDQKATVVLRKRNNSSGENTGTVVDLKKVWLFRVEEMEKDFFQMVDYRGKYFKSGIVVFNCLRKDLNKSFSQ